MTKNKLLTFIKNIKNLRDLQEISSRTAQRQKEIMHRSRTTLGVVGDKNIPQDLRLPTHPE
jgi:hypothetical protein